MQTSTVVPVAQPQDGRTWTVLYYVGTTNPDELSRHAEEGLRIAGFQVLCELRVHFPNHGDTPDGWTHLVEFDDGSSAAQGGAPSKVLAESHYSQQPHFGYHTYPLADGLGVTQCTLTSCSREKFERFLVYLRAENRWPVEISLTAELNPIKLRARMQTLAQFKETENRSAG